MYNFLQINSPLANARVITKPSFSKFLPDAVSDVISGVADEQVGMGISAKFGNSRPKRSWDIRAAHFLTDDAGRRTQW